MKWFRMAGGLMTGMLAFASAMSAQGGNSDPIAVTQEKADESSRFEGRWSVVSGTVDGDGQDMQGDKVRISKGEVNAPRTRMKLTHSLDTQRLARENT